ncbi:MAG: DUF4870 domain-containing protein [Planctomycetota bacterium]
MFDSTERIEAASAEEQRWGAIAHLSALLPLPLFDLLGPVIVLLTKGDQSDFVRRQAIEAINFHISVFLGYIVCAVLSLILIGIFMAWALGIAAIVLAIVGGIKASEGRSYRYPFTVRFFS